VCEKQPSLILTFRKMLSKYTYSNKRMGKAFREMSENKRMLRTQTRLRRAMLIEENKLTLLIYCQSVGLVRYGSWSVSIDVISWERLVRTQPLRNIILPNMVVRVFPNLAE
jgi:hypothetical protein